MTAGDWKIAVDEGTEQEWNISTIIAVVYQLVINSLYEVLVPADKAANNVVVV